jgi:DNA polymerase III subunit beta
MKLICERDELNRVLSFVTTRANSKIKIPVLQNVKIEARHNEVALMATDLDTRSEASCNAEVSARGAITVPAERLARLIDGLPRGSQVSLSLFGNDMKIDCGRSHYKLPTMPVEDFPDSFEPSNPIELTLSCLDVRTLFDVTAAIVVDGSRKMLEGGLLYQPQPRQMAMVGTRGTQLVRRCLSTDLSFAGRYIIPKPAMLEIVKLASEGEVLFRCGENAIEASNGRRLFCSKLIEAIYPDIDRLIPSLSDQFILVDHGEFVAAVKRLSGLATEYSTIDLIWKRHGPVLEMKLDGDGSGAEEITCECNLTDGSISFGPAILGPMLDVLKGDTLQLHVEWPDRVARLADPSDDGLVVLAFPRMPRSATAEEKVA